MSTMNDRIALPVIGALSVVVPIVVAVLLYVPIMNVKVEGFDINILPFINACINSSVTILLLLGFYFIRKNKISYHKTCMISAFILSCLFLLTYIAYHSLKSSTGGHTVFGGTGFIRYFYYFILITHILLATIIVPLALLSIYRGINIQYELHKKISKWTLPIWLYVSITGVLVYILISPYY